MKQVVFLVVSLVLFSVHCESDAVVNKEAGASEEAAVPAEAAPDNSGSQSAPAAAVMPAPAAFPDSSGSQSAGPPIGEVVDTSVGAPGAAPPPLTNEQINEMKQKIVQKKLSKVVMPTIVGHEDKVASLDKSKCVDTDLYKNTEKVKAIDDENEYLCAFVAFQANKKGDETVGAYADQKEATDRYVLFKSCINRVNEQNNDKDSTWTAGVNFFCDMTDAEKYPYSHGIRDEEDEGGLAPEEDDDDYEGNTIGNSPPRPIGNTFAPVPIIG